MALARRRREADFCARRMRLVWRDVLVDEGVLLGVVTVSWEELEYSVVSMDGYVGVEGRWASCSARLGECASIWMGSGMCDLTQGRTL